MRSVVSVLFASSLAACASAAPGEEMAPYDPYEEAFGAGGAADGAGAEVIDVQAGDRLELSVEAVGPDGAAILGDHVIAVRVRGGQSVALVMRTTSPSLDPYILVKDPTKRTLAESHDQVIAPAAGASDSIVSVSTDGAIAFLSGEGLESGGTFTLDVVGLDAPLPQLIEGTIAKEVGRTLDALEDDRASAVVSGWLTENDNGFVTENLDAVPLANRSSVSALRFELNDARSALAQNLNAGNALLRDLAKIWAVVDDARPAAGN